VRYKTGFDGQYGKPIFDMSAKEKTKQKNIGEFA
jgi:hypothetical protein